MPLILSKLKKSNWQESPFVNLLGKVESKNDYSAYNILNPLRSRYKTNLTNLTINQLQEKQNNEEIFAAGRYQIIPKTLSLAANYLKIDTSLKFDKIMQDRIFYDYLIRVKRKEIIHYLSSGEGIEDAIYAWAKEFASAGVRKGKPLSPRLLRDKNGNPVKKDGNYVRIPRTARFEGESFYSGDGLNVAHITPDNMVKALAESMEYEWNSDN